MAPGFNISNNIVSREMLMSMLDGETKHGRVYLVVFLRPIEGNEPYVQTYDASSLIIDSPEYVDPRIYSRVDISFKNPIFRRKTEPTAANDMIKYALDSDLEHVTAEVLNSPQQLHETTASPDLAAASSPSPIPGTPTPDIIRKDIGDDTSDEPQVMPSIGSSLVTFEKGQGKINHNIRA